MNKKDYYKSMLFTFLLVVGVFCYGFYLINGPTSKKNSISNVNSARSIEAIHMINKYNSKDQSLKVVEVSDMEEAAIYGPTAPISFTGQMTAYTATCRGCTGMVYCPPRQDVRNGNIWYNDNTYGRVRIMAADPHIPCGTVVKITNLKFTKDEVIGIVLDRGGLIKGNIMDFLVENDDDMEVVGRQKNVKYEVVRWGW